MSHLTLETIARLVDDEPAAAESAHLEGCAQCRAELQAMREDVQALSMLPDVAPVPADSWVGLERRLAEEGLIRQRRFAGLGTRQLGWAAAAVVLFMAGTMAGRLSSPAGEQFAQAPAAAATSAPDPQPGTGAPAADATLAAADAAPSAPTDTETRSAPAFASAGDAQAPDPSPALQPRRGSQMTLASNTSGPVLPRNMDEAALLLRQTEELYLAALTRYAEMATQAESGDPIARLAALQSIVMTTQAALAQAPADPVINGYHLTALAQRDATLRQVATTTSDRLY